MGTHKNGSMRLDILQKACQLISREGVSRLTLEAVAKEVGVSKGGLLYYFSSKEELVRGMVNYVTENYNTSIDKKLAEETDTPGQWLRAFVRMSLEDANQHDLLSIGLLTTMVNNPEILDVWRDTYQDWQKHIEEDGHNLALSTIVRLAADGLWFAELLGFAPPDKNLRNVMMEILLKLTEQDIAQNVEAVLEIKNPVSH